MSVLSYERDGLVAQLILNRPEKLNALNDELLFALKEGLERFDDDEAASVAILRGSGRAFCSGADVKELQLRPPEEVRRFGGVQPRGAQIRDMMFRFTNWKPIVAAVHGYVLGGGLHLALLCDVVVAEEGCVFQVAETARGSDPTVLWSLLAARTNEAFATEVALTARRWNATDGQCAGMVSRVAPQGELDSVSRVFAEEIAENPAPAVRSLVRRRRAMIEAVELESHANRNTALHLSAQFRESAESFTGGTEG